MGAGCSLGSVRYAAIAQAASSAFRSSSSSRPGTEEDAPEESDWDADPDQILPEQARGRDVSSMMRERAPKDHAYLPQEHSGSPPIGWIKRLEREWRVLARGLPQDIHVQLYEDRLDLMRAAIVGPKDTPYSDSLMFFDIHLSPSFPRAPPSVKFWAFKERLNPNLYANGMVCLSLLGTWAGSSIEVWRPMRSNLLQVLVSLQGLVLVEEPYFNEPGFERTRGTIQGSLYAQRYSEDARVKSLRSVLRVFEEPLGGFEDVIRGHFAASAAGILQRLEALLGSPTPRRPRRIDGIELSASSPSETFRREVLKLLPSLRRMRDRLSVEWQAEQRGPDVDPCQRHSRPQCQLRASRGANPPEQPQQTTQPQLLLQPLEQAQSHQQCAHHHCAPEQWMEEASLPEPPDEHDVVPPTSAAPPGTKAQALAAKSPILFAKV